MTLKYSGIICTCYWLSIQVKLSALYEKMEYIIWHSEVQIDLMLFKLYV